MDVIFRTARLTDFETSRLKLKKESNIVHDKNKEKQLFNETYTPSEVIIRICFENLCVEFKTIDLKF